ncbi:sugar kinase [Roseburia hominis]
MDKSIVLYGDLMERLSPAGMGKIVQADQYEVRFTGAEANVGVSCANYGMKAYVVGRVPDHDVGQACINYLRRYGLDTSFIVRGGERLAILYTETGYSQRPSRVIYDRGHSSFAYLEPGTLEWEKILEGKDWFHFSGTAPAMGEGPREELLRGLKIAKQMNVMVSVDYNYRHKLWDKKTARKTMETLMEYVDVGIGNEEDCEAVFGIKAEGTDFEKGNVDEKSYTIVAEKMVKRYGLKMQAITLRESISASKNGWSAILHDGEQCYTSKNYMVDLVDRIGGGDSFAGGLIYGLCSGMDKQAALEFAVAASCIKQTIPGDFNLVSREDVLALVNGNASGRVQR